MQNVTLVLSGSADSGKSALADCIHDWLLQLGVHVQPDPSRPITPQSLRRLPLGGVTVTIVEVESTDTRPAETFAGDRDGGLSGGLGA